MCEEWKSLTMYKCVGTRFNVSGDWDSVFQVYKDRFVEIDGYIADGLKKAKESCSQGMNSHSGMKKAYAGLVTFNLEVTEIARAYIHEIGSLEKLGFVTSKDTRSSELRICVSQAVGRSLTDKEATFVVLQIYNAKIRAFRGIFPLGAREVGSFDIFETQRILLRSKRYVWTEGLAAVTGLVASSTVDDIKINQKELAKGEEINSVQIVMLEKETNVMLGNLRNQSDSMKNLYSDERELQERLAE